MKYLLEMTVFICGAVVMVFEIVGSRVVGPYLGTSIIVWTSIIGIILGSLSLGYYLGGKIADKKADYKGLSFIIFFAGILLFFTFLTKDTFLVLLQSNIKDLRINSILAAIILFAPVSVLLGIVSPYSVKLKIKNIKDSGKEVGKLYAISTIGSIFGTFGAGFYLIPMFGTNNILVFLFILLISTSLLLNITDFIKTKITFIVIGVISINVLFVIKDLQLNSLNAFVDTDTLYNRVWVGNYNYNKKVVKRMLINNEWSSAMNIDGDNSLIFDYTKYYDLAKHFNPDFKDTLMIGGAAYSYPKYFLEKYPQSNIDVVEIDAGLTKIAKEHFNLKDNERLKIIHEDGRIYLNNNEKKYDVIYGDAFKSHYSIPYHLTTKEATEAIYNNLNDDGVVLVNIISAINGDGGEFLRAELATYKEVFPQVVLFKVRDLEPDITQNLMMVGVKNDNNINFKSEDKVLQGYLNNLWTGSIDDDMPVLTDDYAPVDYYISKTIN